jgi:hypothetical protein
VHERYEVGEGWEYPFRLSESYTVSGENTPEANSAGWKVLPTPTKCAPFLYLNDLPCFQRCHAGRRCFQGAGNVMRCFGVHIWQETGCLC